MKRKLIFVALIFFAVGTFSFAQNYSTYVDLGDVRIYPQGSGSWIIESDRINMTLPLKFTQKDGWIEIVCSDASIKFVGGSIDSYVRSVVGKALIAYPIGGTIISYVAGKVAGWAAKQTISSLCE